MNVEARIGSSHVDWRSFQNCVRRFQHFFFKVLIYRLAGDAKVYMTRAFVLHVVRAFNEELNMRAVRRRLAELCASDALAFCAGQHRNSTAPYVQLGVVPSIGSTMSAFA